MSASSFLHDSFRSKSIAGGKTSSLRAEVQLKEMNKGCPSYFLLSQIVSHASLGSDNFRDNSHDSFHHEGKEIPSIGICQ